MKECVLRDPKTGKVEGRGTGKTYDEARAKAHKQMLSKPFKIDGITVSEEELADFLDWSFVTDCKDFKQYRHLKETGWFDKHPITAKDLQNKVMSSTSK